MNKIAAIVALAGVATASAQTTFFENLDPNPDTGQFSGFPDTTATGAPTFVSAGDYISTANDDILLTNITFVGGITDFGANGISDGLTLAFFDTTNALVDLFTVDLTAGLNFQSIDLNPLANFVIPSAGTVALFANGDDSANWLITLADATVGDNGVAESTAGHNSAFSLTGIEVPAPGAAVLAGVAGLVATRRRRG